MRYSLKDYRLAKQLVKDLQPILKVIDLSIRGLTHYEKTYMPAARLIAALKREQALLQSHFEKQKKVLENKGKNDE